MLEIVTEYVTLVNESDEHINAMIKENWQPLGPPFPTGMKHRTVVQVMVKYRWAASTAWEHIGMPV